jgi:hypothetical protein
MNENLLTRIENGGKIETKRGTIEAYKGAKGNLVIDFNIYFPTYVLPLSSEGEGSIVAYIQNPRFGPGYQIYIAERNPQQNGEEKGIMRISYQEDYVTVVIRGDQLKHPIVKRILGFLLEYSMNPEGTKEKLDKCEQELFNQL